MSALLTNLSSVANFKTFWVDFVNYGISDSEIQNYLNRATYLISNYGTYVVDFNDPRYADVCNLLARRLVYSDKHPYASAEPAGVRAESAKGVSYSTVDRFEKSSRNIKDLLGSEVINILDGLVDSSQECLLVTNIVFQQPRIFTVARGTTTNYFDGPIDEGFLQNTPLSERFGRSFVKEPLIPAPIG